MALIHTPHQDEYDPDCAACEEPMACIVCGCTDEEACPGGCEWVETESGEPVCSSCVEEDAA